MVYKVSQIYRSFAALCCVPPVPVRFVRRTEAGMLMLGPACSLLSLLCATRSGLSHGVRMGMEQSLDELEQALLRDLQSAVSTAGQAAALPTVDEQAGLPTGEFLDNIPLTSLSTAPSPLIEDIHVLRRRRRRANSGGHLHGQQRPLCKDGLPPVAQPHMTTLIHDGGDGFFECDLEVGGEVVGRITFIDQSPTEVCTEVYRTLGASCAELKNVEVSEHMRGFSGGTALINSMCHVLHERGCQYVLLEHLDRGSGQLVRYYEGLGFRGARNVLPPVVDNSDLDRALNNQHMLVPLADLLKLVDPAPTA